ncbi:hypothetical protein CYMTET_52464 [Cymbomonas tetramitiformis]|uniref:Uncharacterized protein n=1 Tax=Cymbomonas tetramitiformis TaxID=36881 RepID=A0AAE0BK41_9CHLO|nr:hypothetical protein CYMTET_52464 [Cymbomonas tetramitiformis]
MSGFASKTRKRMGRRGSLFIPLGVCLLAGTMICAGLGRDLWSKPSSVGTQFSLSDVVTVFRKGTGVSSAEIQVQVLTEEMKKMKQMMAELKGESSPSSSATPAARERRFPTQVLVNGPKRKNKPDNLDLHVGVSSSPWISLYKLRRPLTRSGRANDRRQHHRVRSKLWKNLAIQHDQMEHLFETSNYTQVVSDDLPIPVVQSKPSKFWWEWRRSTRQPSAPAPASVMP